MGGTGESRERGMASALSRMAAQGALAFGRFPAAGLLAVANVGVSAFACCSNGRDSSLAMLLASALGIVLSVGVGLLAERFTARWGTALALQLLVMAIAVAMSSWFEGLICYDECFGYPYALTMAAAVAIVLFELGRGREDASDVVPMLAFAGMVAFVAAVAVGAGLSLVFLALDELFSASLGSNLYSTTWMSAFTCVAVLFAIAYGTRKERFVCPKVWKALVDYVGFPVFMLLMCVMLAYCIKCAVTASLPNGQVNAFVLAAATLWMAFHLLASGLEGRIYRAFVRYGAVLVLPLIALQAVALWIRISEYGLTPARYLSCLFAAATAVFGIGSLVSSVFSRRAVFLVAAALALFAAHTPWNVVDFSVGSQFAKLEGFRARVAAGETLSEDEKFAVMDAWDYTRRYEKGAWRYILSGKTSFNLVEFEKEWGFKYQCTYERRESRDSNSNRNYFNYYRPNNEPFSTKGFAEARLCDIRVKDSRVIVALDSEKSQDITEQSLRAFADGAQPKDLRLDLGDGRLAVVIRLYLTTEGDKLSDGYGTCLVFGPQPTTAP